MGSPDLIYEYCLEFVSLSEGHASVAAIINRHHSKKSDFLFYSVASGPTIKHTVQPLYNGHFRDRRKWPL